MTDITELLANAQPRDEFLTRGGETMTFIGRGQLLHFETDGTSPSTRQLNGRWETSRLTNYDIVAAKPKPVTRWIVMAPDSAMHTKEHALEYIEKYSIRNATVVKVTFTPGEHQS